MASPEPTFVTWQAELRSCGFKSVATGGRRGIYMTRDAGPLTQAVGIMIGANRGGAFNVQLHLSMPLRCAEPPYDVILLSGDLSSDGVRIEPSWSHDPGFPTWWPSAQVGAGLQALVRHGIGWLDHFGELEMLGELFEEEFLKYDDEAQEKPTQSFLAKLRRRFRIGEQPPARAYREYLLWLAMIYEERGLIDLARDRLEAFAVATAQHTNPNEQARINRHRQALREHSV